MSKSIINFSSFDKTSYISIRSTFAVSEFAVKIFALFALKSFVTLSLIAFALSFSGLVIFLEVGHLKKSTLFIKLYALSQFSKFAYTISSCWISDKIILSYCSSSLSNDNLFSSACSFFMQSSSSSFIF